MQLDRGDVDVANHRCFSSTIIMLLLFTVINHAHTRTITPFKDFCFHGYFRSLGSFRCWIIGVIKFLNSVLARTSDCRRFVN